MMGRLRKHAPHRYTRRQRPLHTDRVASAGATAEARSAG